MGAHGYAQIKQNPFFSGVQWERLHTIAPPPFRSPEPPVQWPPPGPDEVFDQQSPEVCVFAACYDMLFRLVCVCVCVCVCVSVCVCLSTVFAMSVCICMCPNSVFCLVIVYVTARVCHIYKSFFCLFVSIVVCFVPKYLTDPFSFFKERAEQEAAAARQAKLDEQKASPWARFLQGDELILETGMATSIQHTTTSPRT